MILIDSDYNSQLLRLVLKTRFVVPAESRIFSDRGVGGIFAMKLGRGRNAGGGKGADD